VDLYRSLFEMSKLLLSQEDGEKTAEVLLRRVLEATGAERGFIVVRQGETYEQKFDVRYDRAWASPEERRFSRSLVRQALETGAILDSPNLLEDPRFSGAESVQRLGPCAVLVVPLSHQGQVWGVVYLEKQSPGTGFPAEARQLAAEFAGMAGLCLRTALEKEALLQRSRSLERDLFSRHDFRGIVTQHPKMLELLKLVAQVADSEATVLVGGESGTGKELVAQALHCNSSRRSRPLVALHCAALPSTVLESELFGHVRGAFTGAERDRPGRIASASGGTLFLDEVAEIPPELQAKLLRFLQFGEIQRLGADRTEKVDVRVVAATLQDLPALVKAGRFRQDLYFRLKVIELRVPALRERLSDVPLLLEHFVRKHWKRPDERPRWSARAERVLLAYEWPGNVRELEHLVQRACLLATGPELGVELLPPELAGSLSPEGAPFEALTNEELKAARDQAVEDVERTFVVALMRRHEGNVSRAAREAGMPRRYLQKLLVRHRAGLGGAAPE
jgi:transcriptional regulator with GAF, ATPase, and Fis domain